MSDLKPCPFCGGEASIEKCWNFDDESPSGYFVWCHGNDCVVEPMTEDFKEEAEAIAAWNSRADYHGFEQAAIEAWESVKAWNTRTDDYEQAAEYWQRMYEQTFAERTCHDTGENEWHFVCSACGYEQNGYECWNFCPSCGCKVVGE